MALAPSQTAAKRLGTAVGRPSRPRRVGASYAVRARPRRRSSGSRSATSASRSSGRTAGRKPHAVVPERGPRLDEVGDLGRGAGDDARVGGPAPRRGSRGGRAAAHPVSPPASSTTARSATTRSGSPVRPTVACAARTSARIDAAEASSCGVTNTTSARARGQLVRDGRVREGGHHRLPLRRARRDRRAAHREPRRLDVDAVHLVAVDEPARLDVADLGVVLPAVPQRADGVDDRGGLVEPLAR